MKFIYFTDPHCRIQSPTYRLDDYCERILLKLDYISKLGKENEVDGYIIGGDILDRPDIPYSLMARIMAVFRKYGKPIYTVLGNHEEYGYNPGTHHRTALSVATASGLLTRLSMENPIILKREEPYIETVSLTGCDAHSNLDKGGRVSDYVDVPEVKEAISIHVVHGFLATRPWPQVPVTVINDILHTKADIVLSGHEHSGFGIIEKGGRLFCNPGALGRVTASVGDVNLEVKVALIDTNNYYPKITLIKLPPNIAPPADEVIDRAKLLQDKAHKQAVAQFAATARETMEKFQFGAGFNLDRMLDALILEESIPPEVEILIRGYIARAEEELKKEV
jgi:DNA repair exonuclease SbcCD nuclease subunit